MPTARPRIAFKAGRAFRRGDTNFVDANPTKGAIILTNGEDGLLHFVWKNRVTDEEELDLIMFPGDAEMLRVDQSAWGRTFVLKFSSSSERHFFWMQDADFTRDYDFIINMNRLLEEAGAIPIWHEGGVNIGMELPSTLPGSSRQPGASTSALPQSAGAAGHQPTPEELAAVQSIVASMNPQASQPDISLTDVLTASNLSALFTSHPELVPALFPHLPPDLPSPPSEEALSQIAASLQFRSAVRSFDQALRTGLLGGLVRGLGLPEEAGTGVEAFLRAVQEQAGTQGGSGSGSGDSMDTD